MGLFDRIGRVLRANINDLVNKAEDPEKILEQSIIDMQEDLIQLRQAVASAIASQKKSQQQYNTAQNEANKWQQRAQLALQKGDENLAREALQRKKAQSDSATTIKVSLEQQTAQVDTLKKNLMQLEGKISEAKTKKDMLKARMQAAKAQENLQNTVSNIGTSSSLAAFDRMEEKVLQMEARSQAAYEIGGTGIEEQFAALEGSDVDDELAAMKAQLTGASPNQAALPQGTPDSSRSTSEVDDDLEQLRRELDKS
ncbi:PspA/IM30 family protein [Roseofilum reptotaenium CS-1145]|uniref:Phage shock protein A n=1 Tax=Roseofilum reptotaenium AO1-A TaxID=1925591 RepID=A0A1L9QL69_9CYAN|nr:PspA/IM30 family protein [Roseofilum reptotaenium]MDB9517118.1 PspA/IM30 family protein [Roseofilum reptotaenium CS-1145]OJJ18937.1 hypothetical protein BI308_21935 [Roseofilum reptotaenium AO1-A]